MEEHVRYDVHDRIAVVTLNRPEKLDAYSGAMAEGLARAYEESDRNGGIRAVVLTGAGRAFCAGADLDPGGDTFSRQDPESFRAAGVRVAACEVRKPVIAANNGYAVGIGRIGAWI